MSDRIVYLCHAVDTEGPLNESLSATFQRITEQYGVTISPTKDNLEKIRKNLLPLNGLEEKIAEIVREDMIDGYLGSWDQIDAMHQTVMSSKWRNKFPDSDGNPYVISWHCMDHVNFENNPRERAMGFHAVYEHYDQLLRDAELARDQIGFHFHPPSISRDAHRQSVGINLSVLHNEILARRIIDHKWFPTVFRPGGHQESFDINLWLEQWIPFDIANQNTGQKADLDAIHPVPGRFVDWRGATTDWEIYNPSVHDHRQSGELNRYVSRLQNLNTRYNNISKSELVKAFDRASSGNRTLVSVSNHDFRNMIGEIEEFCDMVTAVASKYDDVKYLWCNGVEGFRAALKMQKTKPAKLAISLENNVLHVKTQDKIWGPQPFLALRTLEGRYYRDDFILNGTDDWSYVFDVHTIGIECISDIGIATNDSVGNVTIDTLNLQHGAKSWETSHLHTNDWI